MDEAPTTAFAVLVAILCATTNITLTFQAPSMDFDLIVLPSNAWDLKDLFSSEIHVNLENKGGMVGKIVLALLKCGKVYSLDWGCVIVTWSSDNIQWDVGDILLIQDVEGANLQSKK